MNYTINDFVVTYDYWYKARDLIYWGDDIDHLSVEGSYAEKLAKKGGIEIVGKLLPDVYYIFRLNKKGTKLIPLRVSMHPKTSYNIEKGSKKYGSMSILNEVL